MRLLTILLGGAVFFLQGLLEAAPALAVQTHGPPEGYYVHQMAHAFFAFALAFFLYLLQVRPVGRGKAWRYFKVALFFFLLWNIWTLTAHWLADQLPAEALATQGSPWRHTLNAPFSALHILYYISRFDHLLCVPGIWFLMLSLREFCLERGVGTGTEEDGHG